MVTLRAEQKEFFEKLSTEMLSDLRAEEIAIVNIDDPSRIVTGNSLAMALRVCSIIFGDSYHAALHTSNPHHPVIYFQKTINEC